MKPSAVRRLKDRLATRQRQETIAVLETPAVIAARPISKARARQSIRSDPFEMPVNAWLKTQPASTRRGVFRRKFQLPPYVTAPAWYFLEQCGLLHAAGVQRVKSHA